ncbi:MAG: GIY-YIG nuclease family protein [Halanaerobiales bacterium]
MTQNSVKKTHYVYIVQCSDLTYYTGYTTDIKRRVAEHNNGKGAKYTRGRTPVRLVYYEEWDSKNKAMKREYEIKQLTRDEKECLLES